MNNMILYVIRHGKTKSNEQRLYCGKTNDVLSEAGIKEIKEKQKCYNYPVCAKTLQVVQFVRIKPLNSFIPKPFMRCVHYFGNMISVSLKESRMTC